MSRLKTFRLQLQTQFEEAFGFKFVPGRLDGPITDRNLGCVWISQGGELAGDVNTAQLAATVRVFRKFPGQIEPTKPLDPSPLEEYVELLQATIKDHSTGLGPWFQRLVTWEIDPVTQGVEAVIIALEQNYGI